MALKHVVLSAMGPDRPGIVKEFSSVIHKAGGNIEDSRMAILAGDFAIIVLFTASDEELSTIRKECAALEKKLNFHVHFKESEKQGQRPAHRVFELEATGVDQPGIVHSLSATLADLNINVVSLESRLNNAAFHGTAMFTVRAEIQLAEDDLLERLKQRLERVCDQLDLSYELNPVVG